MVVKLVAVDPVVELMVVELVVVVRVSWLELICLEHSYYQH